jgi:GGDEF domain-containing protein
MPFTGLVSAELLVRGWLAGQFAPIRVVTELPANLADVVPVIQVTRFGGSDDVIVLDNANTDVDTYAATREAALALAEQVRTALRLHLTGVSTGGGVVTGVTTISAPRVVPYDNTSLRRVVASYRITIHSVPS